MDLWIDLNDKSPKDFPVYVWFSGTGVMIIHNAGTLASWNKTQPNVTHWRPLDKTLLPPTPCSMNIKPPDVNVAALYAWREANPDYTPDDEPSSEFIKAFKLGAVWKERALKPTIKGLSP